LSLGWGWRFAALEEGGGAFEMYGVGWGFERKEGLVGGGGSLWLWVVGVEVEVEMEWEMRRGGW
jgi:hypothetical protein